MALGDKISRRDFILNSSKAALAAIVPFEFNESRFEYSLNYSLDFLMDYVERITSKIEEPVLFAPHFDYTHFNRVKGIIDKKTKQVFDVGARSKRDIIRQRRIAQNNLYPVDYDVGLAEFSMVALANFIGRSRVDGKLLVPKHFPGGTAEIELTEVEPVIVRGDIGSFGEYMRPFERLTRLGPDAVMVGHASYPIAEEYYSYRFGLLDEVVIVDLLPFGLDAQKYRDWVLVRPASMSPILVKGVLRGELGFEGCVVSDAYEMESVSELDLLSLFDVDALSGAAGMKLEHPSSQKYMNQTLLTLFSLYAGVDYPLMNNFGLRNRSLIDAFYSQSSSFRLSLDGAFEKFSEFYSKVGVDVVEEYSSKARLRRELEMTSTTLQNVLFDNSHLNEYVKDVWDQGTGLHRMFRRHFFANYFGDKKFIFDDKYLYEFSQAFDLSRFDDAFVEKADWLVQNELNGGYFF